jgi:ubiquitin-conjugating enzyme E2 Q
LACGTKKTAFMANNGGDARTSGSLVTSLPARKVTATTSSRHFPLLFECSATIISMSDAEEEDLNEVILERDASDAAIEFTPDATPVTVTTAKKEEDKILQSLVERFAPKTGPAHRLLYDLREMMIANPAELGFSTEPVGNHIFNWQVRLTGFKEKTPMYEDMMQYKQNTGRDHVEMQVAFPPDYPNCPPFVRVIQPRFKFHTGPVSVGRSLCTDILTLESGTDGRNLLGDTEWRPSNRFSGPKSIPESRRAAWLARIGVAAREITVLSILFRSVMSSPLNFCVGSLAVNADMRD